MNYLSFSVSSADIAGSLSGDGDAFAELMNEIVREGPASPRFLVDFAAGLDEAGRALLVQLQEAVDGHDAEGG